MLSLNLNHNALDWHHKLIRCWVLRKMKGNLSKRNKDGHNCGDKSCEICVKIIQKASLPQGFIDFMTDEKLDLLLLGKPDNLLTIQQEFIDLNLGQDNELVKQLFVESGYKNWFQPNYGKKILNLINQDTCTYCNRNYTLQIVPERSRAELDHWFPKETYYLLALSFYNLIPSCHSCNHLKLNGVVNADFAHPYLLKEENQHFKFSFSYSNKINDYEIKLDVETGSKMDRSLSDFRIKEIYNIHSKRELRDLLELRYKYSENYIDILINKTFKGIMKEDEIFRLVFGIEINEEDYHKRPFSKFKHDIIEELKRIK